jgi:hypothetical protein
MPRESGFLQPLSYQQEVLHEMYESPELFNEGLNSFEYPLYFVSDEELDYFLGSIAKKVARAAGGAVKTVGKAVNTVNKFVPMSVLTSTLNMSPLGMAVRAGLGAAQAAADGRNVFQGALRSLAADPVSRFYVDAGMAAARGENVLKAIQQSAQAQIGDLRQSLQFAAMVAPFIPGIGTGVGAALGAANALAAGQPISDALIAAARNAVPGGAIAQVAFDTAVNLAKGKKIGDALLSSARSRLPGGPAAQAAFDAALALAKGRNIQDAAFAAAGRLLPPSPFAADALSFVRKAVSGQNIQKAALSTLGNRVMSKVEQQAGPLLSKLRTQASHLPPRISVRPIGRAPLSSAVAFAQGAAQLRARRFANPAPLVTGMRRRFPPPARPLAETSFNPASLDRQSTGLPLAERPGPSLTNRPRLPNTPLAPVGTWRRSDDHVFVLNAC